MIRQLVAFMLAFTLLATQIAIPTVVAQTTPPSQSTQNKTDNTWLYVLIAGGLFVLLRPHPAHASPSPAPAASSAPQVSHAACEKGTVGYEAMKRGLLPPGPIHEPQGTRTGVQIVEVPPSWKVDTIDSNRAFNSKTGQNAVWDDATQQWTDAKTGQAIGSPAGGCGIGTVGYEAMKRGLLPPGPIHEPQGTLTGVQVVEVPSSWKVDASDSNRAFNSKTGQNAVWDDAKQQWFDAKTGQPIGPSGLEKAP